ncbi:hypothetical protein D3C86_967110 [compost metagenome]
MVPATSGKLTRSAPRLVSIPCPTQVSPAPLTVTLQARSPSKEVVASGTAVVMPPTVPPTPQPVTSPSPLSKPGFASRLVETVVRPMVRPPSGPGRRACTGSRFMARACWTLASAWRTASSEKALLSALAVLRLVRGS